MLTFEKIKLKGWANGSFELYLNQDINETPDSDNSNYIGSVDFFGLTDNEASSETHNVKAKNQIFDATTALRAYLSKNPKLGDLRVTIYHRLPEVNGVSQPQKLAVQASVGAVRLEKR